MPNYSPISQWQFPTPLSNTTQQSAAEINDRYQKVANCAEYLRAQVATLQTAATALLNNVNEVLATFTTQQSAFNTLAVDAGNKASTANANQTLASNAVARLTTANNAVTTARNKLTVAEGNADGVINSGMLRSSGNLDAIAAAARTNPGILGLNNSGAWIWYSAPSGNNFTIEFVTFMNEYGPTVNGGVVVPLDWNIADINKANYGNFRNIINLPQDVVEESNRRLNLKAFWQYWQATILGSNTNTLRGRFTLDGVPVGRSLSTKMANDSNSNTLRHFNQEVTIASVIQPNIDTSYLQIQTYHNSVNSAINSAGRGLTANKGINTVYMVGYGFRVRNL
jgi:hypothetical protein